MNVGMVSMRGTAPVVQPQQVEKTEVQKNKGGGGKAIASTFIPGLGQMCDGRTGTGLKFLGGVTLAGIASKLAYTSSLFAKTTKGFAGAMVAGMALGLTAAGLWIANIVDAYKGGKSA